MKWIGAILFLAVFIWDLLTDYNKWKGAVDVVHTWEAVVRSILLLPSLFFLSGFGVFTKPFRIGVPYKWGWKVLASMALMGSVFWLGFDIAYNLLRGFPVWFNGSVDGGDSILDLFLMKLTDWQEALLKIGLVIGSIVFYIKANDTPATHI